MFQSILKVIVFHLKHKVAKTCLFLHENVKLNVSLNLVSKVDDIACTFIYLDIHVFTRLRTNYLDLILFII